MTAMLRSLPFVFVFGLCTAQCSDPNCAPGNPAFTFTMGTGDPSNPTVFNALAENGTVQLTTGNQGGQHIWIQLRAQGVCPDRPVGRIPIYRESDNTRIGYALTEGMRWQPVPGTSGLYSSETLAVQVDDQYFCSVVNGGMLRIEATVTDTTGRMTMQSIRVRLNGWSADSLPDLRAGREQCCADRNNRLCYPDGPGDAGSTTDASMATRDATTD